MDGGSSDNSREIAEKNSILSENHGGPVIDVLDNPGKYVSAARNLALENVEDATHMFEIIGHTWVPEDHLQLRVDDLLDAEQSLGRNIGSMGSKIKPSEEINGIKGCRIDKILINKLLISNSVFGDILSPYFGLTISKNVEQKSSHTNLYVIISASEILYLL